MKPRRIKTFFLILTALTVLLASLSLPASAEAVDVSALYKKKDTDDSWSAESTQSIDLNTLKDGETLTISQKGDYVLSGTLRGQILIEVPEEDKVRLILNGVSITSPEGPAIYEKSADKLIVTLAEGTENSLTDGVTVTDDDDTIGAALYAEDDLSINGAGSLTASGTQKHGIQSKADLVIANGQITVSAVLDGIRGRNSVLVLDGKISVTAGGDGITSTRTDAEGKGWIVLAGGEVTVKTGDGAGAVRASANSRGGMNGWGGFGGRGRWDDWGGQTQTDDSGVSQKAVKAAADLTVLDGTYAFDCADDGLHGVNVTVDGGTFSILSGDDAMHADEAMTVNGGAIDVSQCYEGLEGKNVTVNGGQIRITASDDGINASGGNDGSGFGGWGRGGGFSEADNGGMLTITGGQISVNAGGDGLDSNGSILMSGGIVGVWTAANGMEGPIDFNGTGTISGGTLIVACSGGMGGSAWLSGQTAMTLSVSGGAGETVTVLDGNGTEIGTFTPANAFSTLMISSDRLQEGSACTVTAGSRTLYSGAVENNSNMYNGYGYGPGNGGFGPGGGRHGRRGW